MVSVKISTEENTYGKTREQKQPRKAGTPINSVGADIHHITTT
jgi:hypothetical protein